MTTRRSFLIGTAGLCGAAVLPTWATIPATPDGSRRSVLLFTDHVGARTLPALSPATIVDQRALSLDLAADSAHIDGAALAAEGHSALVALGTPAAAFALRVQLGSHWRAIVQGFHGAEGHRVDLPMALTGALSGALARVPGEDEFAAFLLELADQKIGLSSEDRVVRHLRAQRWAGTGRASLLAWPARTA